MAGTDNTWRKAKRLSAANPSWPDELGQYGGVISGGELKDAPRAKTLGAMEINLAPEEVQKKQRKMALDARRNRQEAEAEGSRFAKGGAVKGWGKARGARKAKMR